MSTEGYKVVTEYHFEVHGEVFSITEVGKDCDFAVVEEVRKNGQEDCHMVGVVSYGARGVYWEEGENLFVTYGSKEIAKGILLHIAEYGLPC